MIIVTGKPRSGTSMMMHLLHTAGVPLAFDNTNRNEETMKKYRNPAGFYEGKWNGEDGLFKCFSARKFKEFPNPRFIYMYRSEEKRNKSMKSINPNYPTPEMLKERRKKNAQRRAEKGLPPIEIMEAIDEVKKYPHIIVDYDKFVTDPESYRQLFITLFPELSYDIIIKGIDRDLYINR